MKIAYCTPSLYIAGGVERVLTLKANYFAEHFGYDVTIILTDGKGRPPFYPLSDKVTVVNLDINFEELWSCSFVKKVFVYLRKQHQYRKKLTAQLMRLRPDITVSLLRREINFINDIPDGSRKLGELHVNRTNYRNFEANETNFVKELFAKFWMKNLVSHLKRLDQFVVLTHEDAQSWSELHNVSVIPDPLSFVPQRRSHLDKKRIIAVGRYTYQKGFDLLLQAWSRIEQRYPDWQLAVYGSGRRESYEQLMAELGIDSTRCHLNGSTPDIEQEYFDSSVFAFSSRFEGFGMVLVEAMACGLPVVSFACPCGPRDIVTDGADGFLVANGDVEALARSLSRVMADAALQCRLSDGAVAKSQRFHMDHLAQQWKQLLENLVR